MVLATKLGKYKGTDKFNRLIEDVFKEEGGFEDNLKKIDQPTNMGITQGTLNRFNRAHPEFEIGKKLQNLTYDDAKLIYNLDFYNHYRIEEINDDGLAKLILHMYVNGRPQDVGRLIQQSIIDIGESIKIDGVVGTDTIRTINKIIKNGKANAFKKILSRNRVVFEDALKDSEKYPGRKKRFERLGQ